MAWTFSPWWVFVKIFITVIIATIPSNWFTGEDALDGVCRESAKAVFDLSQIPLIFIPAFSSDSYLVASMADMFFFLALLIKVNYSKKA